MLVFRGRQWVSSFCNAFQLRYVRRHSLPLPPQGASNEWYTVCNEIIRSNIDIPVIAERRRLNALSFDGATAQGKQMQAICGRPN